MSDPVLCIVVYAVFLAAMAAAHFFKTLDNDLGTAWRTAFAAGVAVAILLFLIRALYPVVGGIALGVLLGQLFLQTVMLTGTGWHLHFVFPWSSAARLGGLAIVTSMAAGGIAASRISRSKDLGRSVAYE